MPANRSRSRVPPPPREDQFTIRPRQAPTPTQEFQPSVSRALDPEHYEPKAERYSQRPHTRHYAPSPYYLDTDQERVPTPSAWIAENSSGSINLPPIRSLFLIPPHWQPQPIFQAPAQDSPPIHRAQTSCMQTSPPLLRGLPIAGTIHPVEYSNPNVQSLHSTRTTYLSVPSHTLYDRLEPTQPSERDTPDQPREHFNCPIQAVWRRKPSLAQIVQSLSTIEGGLIGIAKLMLVKLAGTPRRCLNVE